MTLPHEDALAGRILPGWVIERQPDGTLLMRETQEKQRKSSSGCLLFSACWTAMFAFFAAMASGLIPGKWEMEGFGPGQGGLRPLILPGLLGIYGLYSSLSARNTRQEWHAGPGYLELCWGSWHSGRRKSRRYVDGTLELSHTWDQEDGPQTSLSFRAAGGWLNQGVLVGTRLNQCTPAQIREFAELVAQTTGWPLKVTGTPPGDEAPTG